MPLVVAFVPCEMPSVEILLNILLNYILIKCPPTKGKNAVPLQKCNMTP